MTIELRIEPLEWRLWPVYETGMLGSYPTERSFRQVAVGPLRVILFG